MFHQIQIPYPDCNYFQFLLFESGDVTKFPIEYRMKVYVFGTVASPSVANFALKQIPFYFEKEFSQSTFDTILNNFYIDD